MSFFTAHSTIRQPMLPFLCTADLLSLASVNRSLHAEMKLPISLQKKGNAAKIFHALYRPDTNAFILNHYYFHSANTYARHVFYLLPELFALIQENHVAKLQLAMLCNYGGNEESINVYYKGDIPALCQQMVEELRNNTSLTSCNLGLFQYEIEQHIVEELITTHPTLQIISFHSGQRCTQMPIALYKTSTSCVWASSMPVSK